MYAPFFCKHSETIGGVSKVSAGDHHNNLIARIPFQNPAESKRLGDVIDLNRKEQQPL